MGVTITADTTGRVVVFAALKTGMSPVPPAANPIDVVLFDQEYEFADPVNVTALVDVALHTT